MSGTTRYGFSEGAKPMLQPTADEVVPDRGARTVMGAATHLPAAQPPGATAAPAVPAAPGPYRTPPRPQGPARRTPTPSPGQRAAAAPAFVIADQTQPVRAPRKRPRSRLRAAVPVHTGKTGFPAVARFFGRRNTHGDLVPMTQPSLPALPARSRLGGPLLVVCAAALVSFLTVLVALKLRDGDRAPPAPVPASTAPATPR